MGEQIEKESCSGNYFNIKQLNIQLLGKKFVLKYLPRTVALNLIL